MSASARQIRQVKEAMEAALHYEEWLENAETLDKLEGREYWRDNDESPLYHYELVKQHRNNLRKYRALNDPINLSKTLEESIYRHLAEISATELYRHTHVGTKRLITEFLEEVELSMHYICDHEYPGMQAAQKLAQFERAEHVYGRPALLMSGGAALGIYNIGVVQALLDHDILPPVISGASMGSFIAVVVGSHSRSDLVDLFRNLDRLNTTALQMVSPMTMLKDKVVLDSKQLFRCIEDNTGQMTFREAYEESGLVINISVSPTRSEQKPRLLNYLTSPNVLIAHASLASCAIPGVFPPVKLMCRDGSGAVVPYMGSELWSDGSVYDDIPLQRMSRLHNVNKSIVSQSNPHVIPFLAMKQDPGLKTFTRRAILHSLKSQTAIALDFARDSVKYPPVRSFLDKAHAVAVQQYHGDINIHLPPKPSIYKKILSNPDVASLEEYMLLGKRATWPHVACIRDQTRINRAFVQCIAKLKRSVAEEAPVT
jgi:TAG lipase/steryl ester hydrolase/phospholipase A2/LPA acyltransferase